MTRISEVNFNPPSFEPTTLARELGETPADTIQSAQAAPAVQEGEGFFKRMICCLPRCVLSVVKKVICLLTLGCFCNTKDLSAKEKRELILIDLAKLHKTWADFPPMEERKAAGEAFFQKYPELKETIAVFGVNNQRRSFLNHMKEATTTEDKKKREQEVAEWNAKHFDAVKKEMIEKLEVRFDAAFVQNYIEFIRLQNENT